MKRYRFRWKHRRSLRDLYLELNGQFWGGQLPRALVTREWEHIIIQDLSHYVMLRRVGFRRNGSVSGLRANGGHASGVFWAPGPTWPAQIRILSPLGVEGERQTLLHEMVHCAIFFIAGASKEGHGPRFVAELERLAAMGEAWAGPEAVRYREHPEA